jgi:hypothetical protein
MGISARFHSFAIKSRVAEFSVTANVFRRDPRLERQTSQRGTWNSRMQFNIVEESISQMLLVVYWWKRKCFVFSVQMAQCLKKRFWAASSFGRHVMHRNSKRD